MIDKNKFRKDAAAFRKSLNDESKAFKDRSVFEKLTALEEYKKADTVLIYVSGEIEVETERIIIDALSKGKTVATPKCIGDTNEMQFFVISSFDDLEIGKYGIREPKEYCKKAKTDNNSLCIVPALCVDKNGFRVGFGKGYYDRFLSENEVFSICLCYSENVFDTVPKNEYDKAVDIVVSDEFLLRRDCHGESE